MQGGGGGRGVSIDTSSDRVDVCHPGGWAFFFSRYLVRCIHYVFVFPQRFLTRTATSLAPIGQFFLPPQ